MNKRFSPGTNHVLQVSSAQWLRPQARVSHSVGWIQALSFTNNVTLVHVLVSLSHKFSKIGKIITVPTL